MKSLLLTLLLSFKLFAVTSGSYTVGSGGDYANWAAAAAATENLTGNLTFTQISDVTDNTQITLTQALGGYTLTLTSNKRHNGNFGGGWKTNYNNNTNASGLLIFNCTSASAGALIVVSGLNIKYVAENPTVYVSLLRFTSSTTNITNKVNDCLFDGNASRVICLYSTGANSVMSVYNCVATNGVGSATTVASGFYNAPSHVSSQYENCTAYNFTGTGNGNFVASIIGLIVVLFAAAVANVGILASVARLVKLQTTALSL